MIYIYICKSNQCVSKPHVEQLSTTVAELVARNCTGQKNWVTFLSLPPKSLSSPRSLLIMIHMNEWTLNFNVNKVLTAVWDSVWIRCSVCYISIRLHLLFAYCCNSFDLRLSEFEAETKIHSAILRGNSFRFWFWFSVVNVLHVSWTGYISYLKWRHWWFH